MIARPIALLTFLAPSGVISATPPSPFWSELSLRDMRAHEISRIIAFLPIAAAELAGKRQEISLLLAIQEGR